MNVKLEDGKVAQVNIDLYSVFLKSLKEIEPDIKEQVISMLPEKFKDTINYYFNGSLHVIVKDILHEIVDKEIKSELKTYLNNNPGLIVNLIKDEIRSDKFSKEIRDKIIENIEIGGGGVCRYCC